MFTGLIEDIGEVKSSSRDAQGIRLQIGTAFETDRIGLGDSICCDGACLTVVATDASSFTVELSHETVSVTTFKDVRPGRRLNLERALKLGDRLGGHIVSGHIDGTGRLVRIETHGRARDLTFHCGPDLLRYIVDKGSITIDGISLTVNRVDNQGFRLTLIPHTLGETTLADKRVGQEVNLECDILGKYVEKLISKDGKIDREFLAERGFLK